MTTPTDLAQLIERLPPEMRRFSIVKAPLSVSIYDSRGETYVSPDDAAAMIAYDIVEALMTMGWEVSVCRPHGDYDVWLVREGIATTHKGPTLLHALVEAVVAGKERVDVS